MNLIQIQDQLKSLPSDPRTMQILTSYANGANPAVPPYLALGELNRRKQVMQEAQAAQASQPPQGTVKDQVEQQAGIMALQQGQQQQAMQNAMRMGAQAGQPIPGNIPQPAAQPVGAAGGGLMALLADKARARRMNSGGIVALAAAGDVDTAVAEEAYANADEAVAGGGAASDEEGDDEAVKIPAGTDARKLFALLQLEAAKRRAAKGPEYVSPIDMEEAMMKKYPERFAALQKEQGADALNRLVELQAAQRAEYAKQREENAASKPGILQLLGQAAMQSRGQKGNSALASILGGYSQLQSGADTAALKQEQDLRMRELQLQDVRRQALDKVDEIKRAKAEGDLVREMKAKQDFAKLLKDNNVSLNTLLGKQISAAGALAGSERNAEARELAAKEATKRKGIVTPSEKLQILAQIKALRDAGKDEDADILEQSYRRLGGSTADVGAINAQRNNINSQIRVHQNTLRDYRSSKEKQDFARSEIERLNSELAKLPSPGGAPNQKPPAAAPTITPEEFSKQWAALAPGKSLVGPDGKTYTKAKAQ